MQWQRNTSKMLKLFRTLNFLDHYRYESLLDALEARLPTELEIYASELLLYAAMRHCTSALIAV